MTLLLAPVRRRRRAARKLLLAPKTTSSMAWLVWWCLLLVGHPQQPVVVVAQQQQQQQEHSCQLCPSGSTLQGPNLPIPSEMMRNLLPKDNNNNNNITTCAQLDTALANLVGVASASNNASTTTTCSNLRSSLHVPIDFASYCQCSGVTAPDVCTFCSVTNNPLAVVTGPLFPLTCTNVKHLARSIVSYQNCQPDPYLADFCCGGNTTTTTSANTNATIAATNTTTPTTTSTTSGSSNNALKEASSSSSTINPSSSNNNNGSTTCQFCPVGSTMKGADLPLPPDLFSAGMTIQTCNDLNTLMAMNQVSSSSSCAANVQALNALFDYQSYCQCTGVAAPPNLCGSCSLMNPDKVVSGAFHPLTCTQAARFVKVIAMSGNCAMTVRSSNFENLCCAGPSNSTTNPSPAPSSLALPSPVTTSAPTSPPTFTTLATGTMAPYHLNNTNSSSSSNHSYVYPSSTCQLCPAGSTMTTPDRPIPALALSVGLPIRTCSDIDALLAYTSATGSNAANNCQATLSRILTNIDFRSYCHCSSSGPPGTSSSSSLTDACSFCPVQDASASAGYPLNPLNCSLAAQYIGSIYANASLCTQLGSDATIQDVCCGGSGNYSYTTNATVAAAPTMNP